jgi:hypothetical protein
MGLVSSLTAGAMWLLFLLTIGIPNREHASRKSSPFQSQWIMAEGRRPGLSLHSVRRAQAVARRTSSCPAVPSYPVFVAFSTIPSRRSLLRKNVALLLNQTAAVDVLISVPQLFAKRSHDDAEFLELRRVAETLCALYSNVHCLSGPDFGPGSKLLLPLRRLIRTKTILIVVDDDQLYSPHMACDLLVASERWPKDAISRMTRSFPGSNCPGLYDASEIFSEMFARPFASRVNRGSHVVMGTSSYLVNTWFFDDDIFMFDSCPRSAQDTIFFNDDLWVSAHLLRKRIGVTTILSGVTLRPSYVSSSAVVTWQSSRRDGLWHMSDRNLQRTGALNALSSVFCWQPAVRGVNCL